MATIRRFEEIEAWKTARELTKLIYALSHHGKFERDFGLKDQIRRASVSVMSNIAEGFESKTQDSLSRVCKSLCGRSSFSALCDARFILYFR